IGFNNVRIDLMYRFPDQTLDRLKDDLENFIQLDPDGISTYSLEIEGLPFMKKIPELPSDKLDKEMFYYIGEFLTKNGYIRYAQPDFSKPGKEDKYVLNSWKAPQQLMLGFGAGAHTHYFGGHIYVNVCSVKRYIEAIEDGYFPVILGQSLTKEDLMAKYMVLGVRCLYIDKIKFKKYFGIEILRKFNKQINELLKKGWLKDIGNYYEIADIGLWYIDNISKTFYSKANINERQPRGKKLSNYNNITLYKRIRAKGV
ncbi:unnamed protein product, partial [marine sediment metagenome]